MKSPMSLSFRSNGVGDRRPHQLQYDIQQIHPFRNHGLLLDSYMNFGVRCRGYITFGNAPMFSNFCPPPTGRHGKTVGGYTPNPHLSAPGSVGTSPRQA